MNGFTLVFLTFVLATSAVLLWLAQRQRNNALRYREQVPEAFRDQVGLAVHEKAADYTAAKMRLEQIDIVIGALLVLGWTLAGGLNALAALWGMNGWGDIAAGTGLIISALLLMAVLDMPMDLIEQVSGSGRWVRRVFALPQGYHSLDVRRQDIRQGTPAAIKARERMGEIPQDILNGARLPSLRPLAFQQLNNNAIADSDEG